MSIVDAIIILFLILGALIGFKKGFIKTMVSLIGVILVIVLSFYFKTPIATFMYNYLPFWDFGGLTILNIFLYESIAFLLVFVILSSVLGIIINITGIIEKLLNITIVLGFFSKILGAIAGVLEMIVFIFIAAFVLARINVTSEFIMESSWARTILARTPVLANVAGPTYNALSEIYELQKEYADTDDKESYNVDALTSLIRYGVISKEQAKKLIDDGKLRITTEVNFY
ncbi:MAG: CvpA family protein [Bacilli bacterium]|nr:CvpA family protein [Bacilli bacterium]